MTKKGCCCKEENPFVKHYIAVRCYEYDTQKYESVKIHTIFTDWPPTSVIDSTNEPYFPFKVSGLAPGNSGLVITRDESRKLKIMLRGSGGGAPNNSYGGNGAYIDFSITPFSVSKLNNMSVFVGAGGTGGIHSNFSSSVSLYGGGGGFPLAGWGGSAVAYGDSTQSLQGGGQYIVGAGAGAGADMDFNVRFGGDGGVLFGVPGDGPAPGFAAIQTAGGAGGGGASPGLARRGGSGFRYSPPGSSPILTVGGGGGSGKFGGGGGGPNSSGGGGSSSIKDEISQKPIDWGFPGTYIGPGSRCSPFFSKDKDPGIGANNTGRYIERLGTEYISNNKGQAGQAVEYHRTRWCPCFEQQTSGDATGNFSNGINYICISEGQYNTILLQATGLPSPDLLWQYGLSNIKLSFVLNGARYVLLPWDDNDIFANPLTDHYYCTLGCESDYIVQNNPTDVKYYIPTRNNFLNYSDSRNFFKDALQNDNISFANVTSCCDIFIGEKICKASPSGCASTTDANGDLEGCFCNEGVIPPKYKTICKSAVPNVNGPFIAIDSESEYYYLCIPAFGWRRFGNDSVNELYSFYDGDNPDNRLNLGNSLRYYSATPSLDISTLQQLFCNQGFAGINQAVSGSDCQCIAFVSNEYNFCDPEGVNCPMVFKHFGAQLCAMDVYNSCLSTCQGDPNCPQAREKATKIDADENNFEFQACRQNVYFRVDGCCKMDSNDGNCQPTSGQQCGCIDECGNIVGFNLPGFAIAKKVMNRLLDNGIISNLKNKLYETRDLKLNPKTLEVTKQLPNNDLCTDVTSSICTEMAAQFSGTFKKIKRNGCPPSKLVTCLSCQDCGCRKAEIEAQQRCSLTDLIKEHESYETQMCVTIKPIESDSYTSIAMNIELAECLFYGYTNRLERAQQLIKLESKSFSRLVCGEEKDLQGYRITVCKQCVEMAGGRISEAAAVINSTVGAFGLASVVDDSGWFGTRIMSQACPDCPETDLLKPGDKLFLSFIDTGSTVIAQFTFSSQRYQSCVAVVCKPICDPINNTDIEEEEGAQCCFYFPLTGGRGDIRISFISTENVSYPEWANGMRWQYTEASQGDPCYIPRIGNQTCKMYGTSSCRFEKPDTPGASGQCCTTNTNCADNMGKYECNGVQSLTELCQFCQNLQCCGNNCLTNGCDECCSPDLWTPDCNERPCPPGVHGCVTIFTPQETDECVTDPGSVAIVN